MKSPTAATIVLSLSTITPIGCSSEPETPAPAPEHQPLVIFLVRHGEKADGSDDPQLTAGGRDRAALLAGILRSAEIEYVHSSDFIRTTETAAPTAADHGLDVELYDPRHLSALAETLRRTGGRHLVVGHSNTTPPLVDLLGGESGPAIDESHEYDRLYVVTIGKDGTTSSVMLRYGEPYSADQER